MKKTVWKVFVAIMTLTMFGCGKDSDREVIVLPEDVTYEEREVRLNGINGEVTQYRVNRDTLYILSNEEKSSHFYKANLDGSKCTELAVDLSENEIINSFVAEEDGGLIYLSSYGESEIQNELVKIDIDGKEQFRENMTEELKLSGDESIHQMVADDEGNVILGSGQKVYILDQKLQLTGQIKMKDKYTITSLACTKDRQIVCGRIENREGEISGEFCLLDIVKKKCGDVITADEDFNFEGSSLIDGLEYDFYYKDGFGVYGYSMTDKQWTMVLDSRYSFLTSEDVQGMILAGQGKFVHVLNQQAGEENQVSLKLYSKIDKEELEAKKKITFAAYGIPNKMRTYIKEFNKQNKDCRIELKLYEDEECTKLLMDILSGNVPDIIDASVGISVEQLVAKGLLEELTPYYTEEYKNKIIPSVLEGMKTDDKLYFVAPYFSVNSASGRTSDVGERTGWTMDEMKAVLEKKGNDTIPFLCDDKDEMLLMFLQNSFGDYVDWNTGKCKFNSQEFKDVLALCNGGKVTAEGLTNEEINEDIDEHEQLLTEGKVLLIGSEVGMSIESVQLERLQFGEEVTYIGYPNKERKGSYFTYPDKYGISSRSNVKDEAWRFISQVMSEEYQINVQHLNYYMMPTNQKGFDWKIKAKMATQPYTDEYGQEIQPIEVQTVSVGNKEIKVGPISQDDVDTFVNLINHTEKRAEVDRQMIDIITEEAQMYFKGDRSLEKTVDIIQNRVTTYVNEQK